jgi:hypothetical protein
MYPGRNVLSYGADLETRFWLPAPSQSNTQPPTPGYRARGDQGAPQGRFLSGADDRRLGRLQPMIDLVPVRARVTENLPYL